LRRSKIKWIQLRENVYNNLTRCSAFNLPRHPDRPYTLDYIPLIAEDFIELHGDRRFGDDKAIVAGFLYYNKETVIIVGHQKGRDTPVPTSIEIWYAQS